VKDYLIRATAYDSYVRAFAISSKHTITEAIKKHGLNPLSAIVLGRGLMAVAILNSMNKGENATTTLQIVGDGPMGGIVCIADKKGTLKGYVKNNDYKSYEGKGSFGVGECIGKGYINIIKDLHLKKPYSGMAPLQSGEIGDDLAYYFTTSEQIPSMVALGVKLNKDTTCDSGAGMVIQMMPGAPDNIIEEIEKKIYSMKSATELIKKTKTPEGMLGYIFAKNNLNIIGKEQIQFKCNCSEKKMLQGIISLGKTELEKIVKEDDKIETVCSFCNSKYTFYREQLKKELKGM